ncbi:hypothetical protein ABPG77_000807 [Micractinium sp. CCAP 211/92]
MASSATGLEELLLGEIHGTGVYDLAASVGMVAPDGRLQEADHLEDTWGVPTALSALKQPPAMASPRLPPTEGVELPPVQELTTDGDPAELAAANQSVVTCLQAAGEAAVALHLATLQLEKWSLNEADSTGAAAGADGDGPSSPAEAAAAASLGALHSGDSAAGDTPVAAKRKRTGRSGAAAPPAAAAAALVANGRGSAGGDDAAGGAGKPGGRGGLRHFSMKVCEKVESKGDTTYEQVANELIAEMKAEVAAGLAEQQVDDKNVRRRAYDALNVLEAIGMISKTKKAIRWQGWPQGLGRSNEEKQRAERARALERLEEKRQALQEAVLQAHCLCNLALRNQEAPLPALLRMQEMGLPVPNPLMLPFMLVQADPDAEVDIDISDDNLTATLDFQHWPFVLYDDDRVMRLMGLHHPQAHLLSALEQQGQPEQHAQQPQQQQQPGEIKQEIYKQPAQQQQQAQHQHQHQHQQLSIADRTPSLRPSQDATLKQTQQQQTQQQTQQQQLAPVAATLQPLGPPRLTPSRGQAGGRLPTPALQLSPAPGSPTAAGLGSSVSAMDLGSPPASAGHSTAAGAGSGARAFSEPATAQQQQQQQPILRPAATVAAGVKSEPAGHPGNGAVLPSLAPAGLHPAAAQLLQPLQLQHGDWAQWAAAIGGAAASSPLPTHAPIPLLRPANVAAWPVAQQQQQQQ